MNDLLDLDLSAPAPSNATQPKQGAQAGYGAGRSTFDYLSSMRTTTPSPHPSRSASPFSAAAAAPLSGSNATNGRLAPAAAATGRPTAPAKAGSGAGDDAFSSLFGGSSSPATGVNEAPLSMAERLAKESAAKVGGLGAGSWSTLSPTSTGGSGLRSPSPALAPHRGASMSSVAASPKPPTAADPWDFDFLAAPSAPKPNPSSIASKDPFDLDFNTPPPSRSPAPILASSRSPRNPLDDDDPFDTSSSLLGGGSSSGLQDSSALAGDDFDLLGAFSQPAPPASSVRSPPSRSPAPTSQPTSRRPPSRAATASPPPHVLGSLIEMGFSIPQSRAALVATASADGSWNVEAALEALVEEQQVGEAQARRRDEEAWGSRMADDEDEPRRRNRPQPRAREESADPVLEERPPATGRRAREAAAAAKAKEDALTAAQTRVQEQANELLVQASKIGFSVFKSANAYWETGKKTVKKALDEAGEVGAAVNGSEGAEGSRRPQNGAAGGSAAVKGRPKWWTEDMVDDEDADAAGRSQPPTRTEPAAPSSSRRKPPPEAAADPPPSLFQDSDNEDDSAAPSFADSVLPQRPTSASALPKRPQQPPAPAARPTPAADPPSAEYRSPWRRAKPSPSPTPSATAASAPSSGPKPRRAATPPPSRPPRPPIQHTPSQLASAAKHKEAGNAHFKLGQFGDAIASYSQAIDALPSGSLALAPLYNNRASAKLRNGDERSAGEDASEAIKIILRRDGGSTDTPPTPAEVAALDSEVLPAEASDISLRDQLGKALGKRAKALEATEKWGQAAVDWEALSSGGEVLVKSGGGRKVVSEGVARCRKMLATGGSASPSVSSLGNVSAVAARRAQQANSTPTRPKPSISASAPVIQGSGDAVRALQATSAAASAEEDLRLSLKDSVDARITAWKGGKEANLRALIASLENVLWPELDWKKVGMHELISEGQLKVRYVRAIGKVHPDKLNVNNTTVEQRMIAGGVFAGLNDAWNAHKA